MDVPASPEPLLFGPYRFDRHRRALFRCPGDGQSDLVNIGGRALDVLSALIERPGNVVSKDEIMAAVWPNTVVEEANLTVQISALRRVLDEGQNGESCIQTVSGRGYRFVLPVARGEQAHAALAPAPPMAGVAAATPSRRLWPRRWLIASFGAIAAALLAIAFALHDGWLERQHSLPQPSLVVLPFVNLSADPEQAYLAEAITADLTTDVSRIAGLAVIANSSASVYANKSVDVREVGRELAVGYVVEGSVQRMGERIEVNARLIDAETGLQRWADRFDTDRRNLAQAQADITSRLARTLNLGLVEEETRRIEQQKRIDPDARELAMRGWALWYRPYSPANRMEALDSFERALSIDPRSVDALVGTALILVANIGTGITHDRDHDVARADLLIDSALALDFNSSGAHQVRGMIRRLQGRVDDSAAELEAAVALNRNDQHAMFLLGQDRMYQGRPEEALALFDQVDRLNPRDPNRAFGEWARGACALLMDRVDDAIGHLRKATEANPRIYFFQLYLAAALGLKDDTDAAKLALAAALSLAPEVNTLNRWRAAQPWIADPRHWALFEKTGLIGLRRAGLPEG